MIRKTLAVLGLFVLANGAFADEMKSLQGTWAPTSAQMGSQAFPKETLKQLRLQIIEDSYVVHMGAVKDSGKIRIDPETKPKGMDIIGVEGPNKGQTFRAIYDVSRDELIICYSLQGKKRPTDFKVDAVNNYFRVIYKKVK